jgi:hypothetical protein
MWNCATNIAMAYRAGAFRFVLGQAQERVTGRSPDSHLRRAAAANYAEAARLWEPWHTGKQYFERRVAEARAGQNRTMR